jgi:Bacterial regulatory proteins, luxR family
MPLAFVYRTKVTGDNANTGADAVVAAYRVESNQARRKAQMNWQSVRTPRVLRPAASRPPNQATRAWTLWISPASAQDDVLDVLDRLLTDLLAGVNKQEQQRRLRTIGDLDAAALLLRDIGLVVLDRTTSDHSVRNEIFARWPSERIEQAVVTVSALARPSECTSSALRDVQFALGESAAIAAGTNDVAEKDLISREREVAALLVHGLTDRQIAERLVVTKRTLAAHIAQRGPAMITSLALVRGGPRGARWLRPSMAALVCLGQARLRRQQRHTHRPAGQCNPESGALPSSRSRVHLRWPGRVDCEPLCPSPTHAQRPNGCPNHESSSNGRRRLAMSRYTTSSHHSAGASPSAAVARSLCVHLDGDVALGEGCTWRQRTKRSPKRRP